MYHRHYITGAPHLKVLFVVWYRPDQMARMKSIMVTALSLAVFSESRGGSTDKICKTARSQVKSVYLNSKAMLVLMIDSETKAILQSADMKS